MCRLVAYIGESVFMEDHLSIPRWSLVAQAMNAREAKTPVNADGCGLAWYGDRETPAVYRSVMPVWSDGNFRSLVRHVRSSLFMAHIRAATIGDVSLGNCHPFSVNRHLFAHNGQIGDYARVRHRMETMIAESVARHHCGSTDSEALFLAALSRGLEVDPVGAFSGVLADVLELTRQSGSTKPIRVAAVSTDGDRLVAYHWSSDARVPSLYTKSVGGGVVVASEPYDEDRPLWQPVAPSTALIIDRSGGITSHRLDVGAPTAAPVARALAAPAGAV